MGNHDQYARASFATECILCGSGAGHHIQQLSAESITAAYREELGIVLELPVATISYIECRGCGLRFFDPPITGDEAFYAALQKIHWYYSSGKEEFRIAAAHVAASDRVLEIGAGRGLFAGEIAAATYTGLEFSSVAIELAAKAGIELKAETIEHHAQHSPRKYDVVCAFQVLEHVAQPHSFLRAAIQALKGGGRLMVSVPAEDSFARFLYWDVLNLPPHHVSRWTDDCLRSIARIFDVQLVAIIPDSLRRNMRRMYAQSVADRWLNGLMHRQPQLLDPRLKAPWFRSISAILAAMLRRYYSLRQPAHRGHAVVAIFRKHET